MSEKEADSRCPSAKQLTEYSKEAKGVPTLTTGHGAPIDTKVASLTAGPKGPMLIQVRDSLCLFVCLFCFLYVFLYVFLFSHLFTSGIKCMANQDPWI